MHKTVPSQPLSGLDIPIETCSLSLNGVEGKSKIVLALNLRNVRQNCCNIVILAFLAG